MKKSTLLLLAMLIAPAAQATCYDRAGKAFNIEPDLLRAISFRESSWRADALNVVSPTEYAVGYMQIHSQNFKHLEKLGITPEDLRTDACLNIHAGAYYLALAFKRWGVSWRAVGAYNAGFRETAKQEAKRRKYAREVQAIYKEIRKSNPLQSARR
jgi:soluble lytic murein transglycosylase-like protein